MRSTFRTSLFVLLSFGSLAYGHAEIDRLWNLHGQTTFIPQIHLPFHAPYGGPNSLAHDTDEENTGTATLFADVRLWSGARLYLSPEGALGSGLSGGQGLAGVTNGDVTRVGSRSLRMYISRLYVKQTLRFGKADQRQMNLSLGKVSVTDLFDANSYSHDPHTQFMNWGLMANAAWDYPADTRGYTWGASEELQFDDWSWRAGGFLLPEQANGPHLETDPSHAIGTVTELERRYHVQDRAGAVRLLAFYNRADMGHYRTAIDENPSAADVITTRAPGNRKYGVGWNMEQALTENLGAFLRLGWNDGHTETWAFTEVDRTGSLGLSLQGASWQRPRDTVGLAVLLNGLSKDHRDYLASDGTGFLLGDGTLHYGTETIVEAYYSWALWKALAVTFDIQEIKNPGYNSDRGPVSVGALRLHAEF